LKNLEKLNLSNNEIENGKFNWSVVSFHGLSNLTELIMKKNQIESIQPELFKDLTSLQVIDLSFNKIKIIPKQAFLNCKELRSINLSSNSIDFFDWKCLMQLRKLKEVNLSLNQFKTIKNKEDFLGLKETSIVINMSKNTSIDIATLFNELFKLNVDGTEVRLNESLAENGSVILNVLRNKHDGMNIKDIETECWTYPGTSLDYVIQEMRLSPNSLFNLVAMFNACIKKNNISEEFNLAIVLDQAKSFVDLCKQSVSIDLLEYMFKKNRSLVIQHDFQSYYNTAIEQNNEAVAICVLKYHLKSVTNVTRLFDSDLWAKFNEKKWWNFFEQLLNGCKAHENNFELLEFKFDAQKTALGKSNLNN
jgi:hypothetical protein